MSGRARFPGKPKQNGGRVRVSYKETTQLAEETDYSRIAAQTATNLKAFRALFGSSGESEEEKFPGFRMKEVTETQTNFSKKRKEINKAVQVLQTELITALRTYNFSSDEDQMSSPLKTKKNISNGHSSKDTTPLQNGDSEGFIGFSDEEMKSMRESCRSKSLELSRGTSENGHVVVVPRRGARIKIPKFKDDSINGKTVPVAKVETRGRPRGLVSVTRKSAARGRKPNTLSRSSESDVPKQGTKIVLPSDFENFRRVKGSKTKLVEKLQDVVPILTSALLSNSVPGIKLDSDVITVKDASHIPKLAEGALRSGKFSFEESENVSSEADTDSDQDDEADLNSDIADEEIMLLDRQDGQVRRGSSLNAMIRSLCPLDLDDVEQFGFPVFVDANTGSIPHKPLCFLCGSAGIEQLIFCGTCTEPYHPFCTGDDSLLSSFVSRIVPKSKSLAQSSDLPIEDILRGPIPVYYNGVPNPSSTHNSCIDNNSRLSSLLSPPLTPMPLARLEEDLEKEKELELQEMLRNWTCGRCVECSLCQQHRRHGNEKQNEFLKCSQCRQSYHVGCIKKGVGKKEGNEKWVCDNCFKCKSCGKKVERRMAIHTNCSTISKPENGLMENNSGSVTHMMLCIPCFRQRQKGSFCPVCQACYEDNDFETRMMECGKCERWIHAKCERISEEQYQMLSNLPESIEFICRLCDDSGSPFWRQAIRMEMVNGCQAVFRIFQKKTISTYRKKRVLIPDTANKLVLIESDAKRQVVRDLFNSKDSKARVGTEFKENSKPYEPVIKSPGESEAGGSSKEVRSSANEVGAEAESLKTLKIHATTPAKKVHSSITTGSLYSRSPADFSPSKRINSVFDSVLHSVNKEFTSVLSIYNATVNFLEKSAEEDVPGLHLREHFESAVKEVFPWFDAKEIESSNLHREFSEGVDIATFTKPSTVVSKYPYNNTDLPFSNMDTNETLFQPIQSYSKDYLNPFEDVYWDVKKTLDTRRCSFCQELGDFPPDFCGRLLWAGLNEWVHVNCALWSSEVWEEEDGALQQVGVALTRSRPLSCDICNRSGASVACCQQSCSKSFHFPCALNSNCVLLEDKSVFCHAHSKKAKGNQQQDMQVLRQVFVDTDWLRKKEKLFPSNNIRIFIGSLRVDSIGHIVPISMNEDGGGTALVPLGYKCSRLYWSGSNPLDKVLYSFTTSVSKAKRKFRRQKQDVNLVVDHSKSSHKVNRKLQQVKSFHDWVDTAPRYIDEHNEEWVAPCNLNFSDYEDDSGSDADEEDNTQVEIEDVEFETNNIFPSYTASCVGDSETLFREETNLFGDYLTQDAISHLNTCVQDLIGIDEDWPLEIRSEDESASQTSTLVSEDEYIPKQITSILHHEPSDPMQTDLCILQIDGAYDSSTSASSSQNSNDKSESDSNSDSSSSDAPKKVLPARRGRPPKSASKTATTTKRKKSRSKSLESAKQKSSKKEFPKRGSAPARGGRTLRSREKQPILEQKKIEFKCTQCKRPFPSKTSVIRHLKWCKQNKSTSKSDTSKLNTTEVKSTPTPVKAGAKRGRPPKLRASVDEKGCQISAPVSESPEPGPGPSRKAKMCTASPEKTTPRDCNEFIKIYSSVSETSEAQADGDDNKPVTCTRCKNTYRTGASFKNHLGNCFYYSSSGTEEEEDFNEAENNEMDVPAGTNPSFNVAEGKVKTVTSSDSEEGTTTEDETDEMSYEHEAKTDLSTTVVTVDSECAVQEDRVKTLPVQSIISDVSLVQPVGQASVVSLPPKNIYDQPREYTEGCGSLPFEKTPTKIQAIPEASLAVSNPNSSSTLIQRSLNPSETIQAYTVDITPNSINQGHHFPAHTSLENIQRLQACANQLPTDNQQRQLQEILTQFQNNKDFTIRLKDSVQSTAANPDIHTLPAPEKNSSVAASDIHILSVPPSSNMDELHQTNNLHSEFNLRSSNIFPENLHHAKVPTHPSYTNDNWNMNSLQVHPDSVPNVMFNPEQQIAHHEIVTPQKSEVPAAEVQSLPQPQLHTVTLQDSNGQLVTVQIPISMAQSQSQTPFSYTQQYPVPGFAQQHSQSNVSVYSYQQIQEMQRLQFQQQLEKAAALQQKQQEALIQQQLSMQHQQQAAIQLHQQQQRVLMHQQQQQLNLSHAGQAHDYQSNLQANIYPSSSAPEQNVTYMLVQHGNTLSTIPIPYGTNTSGISFPIGNDHQPVPPVVSQVSAGTPAADDISSHAAAQTTSTSNHRIVQCTANIGAHVSRDGIIIPGTGSGNVSARPCPCTACYNRVCVGLDADNSKSLKKYTKQFSYANLEQCHSNSTAASPAKRAKALKVRAQLASIVSERQGQGLLLYKTMTSPGSGSLPRLLPATVVSTSLVSTLPISAASARQPSITTTTTDSIFSPVVTSTLVSEKVPTPNPNIAVVHPLQKMTDQILQIESTFTFPPNSNCTNLIPGNWVHPNESNTNLSASSSKLAQELAEIQGSLPESISTPPESIQDYGVSQTNDHSEQPKVPLATAAVSQVLQSEKEQTKSLAVETIPASITVPVPISEKESTSVPLEINSSKRKAEELETSTSIEAKPPSQKSIKITLKRQEGADSYSLLNISESGNQAPGTMRSLKIKGKITSGEQAGNTTDVVVEPIVHTIPIPDPDADDESNRTIVEEEEGNNSIKSIEATVVLPVPSSPARRPMRLTHRAVIVYEVRLNEAVVFRSSDVRSVWGNIFETVQGRRLNHNLPPLAYPATNISLPENKREAAASFNQLGLTHRAVQFLLEQLPGINKAAKEKHVFKFHEPPIASIEDTPVSENPSGSARSERYGGRKPFDMFGWLASKHRQPLVLDSNTRSLDMNKSADLPVAMKFRNLNKHGAKHLNVYWSSIHGRGLFTTKDIEVGDMIIEYAGEVIRSPVCDLREKYYESRGIGCYMFRIDDYYVVDATLRGNAARFINHSCEPNCRSKIMEILGQKHIVIIALRRIISGEELTYDYKFPYEEVKIACSCGAFKCRKFLN